MLKKADFWLLSFVFILFLFFSYFKNPAIFKYRFDEGLIDNYFRSQDIEDKEDKIKDRIFLSDSEIYLATGYLYAKGEDPTKFNFQHPPLVKYLFGFATLFFGNPYWVQIFFALFLIFLTYLLGKMAFKKREVAFLASLFLVFDPLLKDNITQLLLDPAQAVFSLFYIILALYFPNNFLLNGFVLGLLFASKFWSSSLLLVVFIFLYRKFLIKEKVDYKNMFLSFLVAFFTFSLTYIKTFIDYGGLFNIFLFELKMLKFMLSHNTTSIFGNNLILFFSGHFVSWWEKGRILKADIWNFFWSLGFIFGILQIKNIKRLEKKDFIFIFPIFYFLINLFNAPFSRYFLIILPFIYLSLASFINSKLKTQKSKLKTRTKNKGKKSELSIMNYVLWGRCIFMHNT